MFVVYEVSSGKNDLFCYKNEDRFECEVWVNHHAYMNGKARKYEIRYEA